MSDGVSNQPNINNSYIYKNQEIQRIDLPDNEELSLFQQENTSELPVDELKNTDESVNNNENKAQSLEEQLKSVEDEQGWLGSAWNSLKGFTGIGSSSEKCKDKIEDFKNGKISYDEVKNEISEFKDKQKTSVDIAANVASGVAAIGGALLAGSVIAATGGVATPLVLVAVGSATGAVTKASLKFTDRATNEVDGDALDGKQILKDSLSGAVDGAASAATMGIGSAGLTAANTIKTAAIETAKSGAKAGSISGAMTGAGDYTIEAAVEDDVDFHIGDFAKTTFINAAAGAVAGSVIGGVSGAVKAGKSIANPTEDTAQRTMTSNVEESSIVESQSNIVADKSDDKVLSSQIEKIAFKPTQKQSQELSDNSKILFADYKSHIKEATEQIKKEFDNLDSKEIITGRAKSQESVLKKLQRKFESGDIKNTEIKTCNAAIGDAYGTRLQMKSISPDEARNIIENSLSDYGLGYYEFTAYIKGNKSELSSNTIKILDKVHTSVLDSLKEKQSQEVVDKLVKAIEKKDIQITELNNYGDEISSYFTNKQLQQIVEAYNGATGKNLKLVTKQDIRKTGTGPKITDDLEVKDYGVNIDTEKAVKQSGYTSAQMNIKHKFSDNTTGNGELQIRGTHVNKLADVEHIPYDIRKGKITENDLKYADIFRIIKKMDDVVYDKYNKFLTDTYRANRLNELGIPSTPPNIRDVFKNGEIPNHAFDLLSVKGLVEIAQRA